MPTPDYGLLKNLPQPDPVGSALDAYQKVSANVRANKATALAQKLGSLQAQKAKIALANQQKDETLTQQTKQAALQASHLQIHSAIKTVHDTRLADIHELPENQKEAAYQHFKQEMTSLHGDTSKLPAHYNDEVAAEAKNAYNQSPLGTADRKFARDTATQQLKDTDEFHKAMAVQALKNLGARQTAAAKPGPGQEQLAKSEAKANSAYKDSVITDSQAGQRILLDTDNISASLNKAAAGYTGSMTNYLGKAGQELKKNTSQLVLDKLQGMHNVSRGTRLLTKIIQRSKPADWMKRGAIQRIVGGLAAVSHRSLEKEKFTQYMWDHGINDRGKIDTMWMSYDGKYPLINVKDNTVNTQNVGRWGEFLASKQQKKAGK